MSTNYFLHLPGKEPLHIGKHSAGWRFIFKGYDDVSAIMLLSRCEWSQYLGKVGGHIRDENDELITYGAFTRLVAATKEEKSHYAFIKADHPGEVDDYWIDSEGWSFCLREFS